MVVNVQTLNNQDTYLWSTNEITSEITITEAGMYSVTVTSSYGCETTQTFNVSLSEQATIETTETIDFSDPNNITITVRGIGNYLYILDDNDPQEENVFKNVSLGNHTIRVIDLNGCAEITKKVMVMDFPKYMTPNNDGHFDTWHVVGAKELPGTIIDIYDRYGRLLAHLTSNSPGWDGSFKGEHLPTNDYWFNAYVNYNGSRFQLKGHFTLKR